MPRITYQGDTVSTPIPAAARVLASLALSLAFVCGSCSVYDTTLLAGARGKDDSSGGSAPENAAGGAPSTGTAARGGREDSTSGGDSGGRAFGGSAGSDSVGGEGGKTVGSTGGASAFGGSESGGSESGGSAFGGSASGGVVSSGGAAAAGAAGASSSSGGGATNGGAGAGGLGGGGPSAGSGGAGTTEGGSTGTGGARETCSGCARLSVPLAATSDQARFVISLPGATDLSTATIAFHFIKRQGTGGSFRLFIQRGGPDFGMAFSSAILLESTGSTVQSVTWSIANADPNLDKKAVERVGIEIAAAGGSTWANPTILYVDRVDVSGSALATGSFSFETAASVYTVPTASGPRGRMWLNSYEADTNVSGAALGWLGP